MSYSLQNTTSLTSLADAIRSKTGDSASMTVEEMITAVNSITTGGGSSSGWIKKKEFYETSAEDGVGGEIVLGSYVDIDTELAKDKEFVFIFTAGQNQSQSTYSRAIAAWILYYDGKGLVNISSTSPSSPSYIVANGGNINSFSFEVNYDSSTGTNVIRINNIDNGSISAPKYDYHLSNGGYRLTDPTRYVWGNMFYLDESFNEIGEVNIPRLNYWNYYGQNNEMIAALFDRLTFNLETSVLSYAFQNNEYFTNFPADWRNKTIYIGGMSNTLNLLYFLNYDQNVKYLPKIIVSNTDLSDIQMQTAFCGSRLVKIDNDAIPQNLIAIGNENSCCSGCNYLREVPENFMANSVYINTAFPSQNGRSMCHHMYDNAKLLKQVIGAPIFGQTTSTGTANRFQDMLSNNNALHHLTFYMPNGAVGTMNATNQIIDLSSGIGYFSSTITTDILDRLEDEDRANVIIISAVNNNATVVNMQNLNSLAEGVEYATYNRQSAIETINSLPDTTAAIASAGGTNTIQFKSGAGSAYGTDYDMSNLSAEEIAVATAKGWTVALV